MVLMGSFQLEIIYDKKDPLYFCLLYLCNSMFKSITKGLNMKQKKFNMYARCVDQLKGFWFKNNFEKKIICILIL